MENRFKLVPHEQDGNLYHLCFSVVLPSQRYYIHEITLILAECKEQYPNLLFSYNGCFVARFPDGQYAINYRDTVDNAFVEVLDFRLTVDIRTILYSIFGLHS